jgi:hypothetical protein
MNRSKAFEAWRQKFRNISLSLGEKLRVVYKSMDFLSYRERVPRILPLRSRYMHNTDWVSIVGAA